MPLPESLQRVEIYQGNFLVAHEAEGSGKLGLSHQNSCREILTSYLANSQTLGTGGQYFVLRRDKTLTGTRKLASGINLLHRLERDVFNFNLSTIEIQSKGKTLLGFGGYKILLAIPDNRWFLSPPLFSLYLGTIRGLRYLSLNAGNETDTKQIVLQLFQGADGVRRLLEEGTAPFYEDVKRNYAYSNLGSCGATGWTEVSEFKRKAFPKWYGLKP